MSPRRTRPPAPRARGRRLTEEEAQLWEYVTQHDERLKPASAAAPKKTKMPAPTAPIPHKEKKAERKPSPAAPLQAGEYAGVDHRSARRLKRGKRVIEARLDLHGHSRERAFDALSRFLLDSAARGRRVVLVITGYGRQGKSAEPGVLRSLLPRWLGEAPLRAHVLAFDAAQPKDGGAGAFYILLRRNRA